MSELQSVSQADFQREVLDATEPVLVDFSAEWCHPCKALDPLVTQLAEEWRGRVKVVKLDADQSPEILMKYSVLGIPSLLLFKGGELLERASGVQSRENIIGQFTPHF